MAYLDAWMLGLGKRGCLGCQLGWHDPALLETLVAEGPLSRDG